jgi:hypothetical protein
MHSALRGMATLKVLNTGPLVFLTVALLAPFNIIKVVMSLRVWKL